MSQKKVKIIFFGTPDFAAGILEALLEAGYEVPAVFTQPDKKVGRKQEISMSAVKRLALEKRISVFQPENLKDAEVIGGIKKLGGDLFVVAAYGKILPGDILRIPKFGAINVHASLLPKYRGASPVQCAILSGEKETGITLMLMNEEMDEGDVLEQKKVEIGEGETAENLLGRLSELGGKMLVELIPLWSERKIKPVPQDNAGATYCSRVKREDGKINWADAAEKIFRQWRALQPWPGTFTFLSENNRPKRLKLARISLADEASTGNDPGKIIEYNHKIAIETGKGLIWLQKIQLEGKKEMDADEFARGHSEFVGSVLG